MIPFNIPPYTGAEEEAVREAIHSRKICGDGEFTKKCSAWLEESTGTRKALLTTSCTHALEMAATLCDIRPGDEVIMPSYTFVSTASAFVLRGGVPVFVDIRPDTMNIDEELIEAAITEKTKCICVVHYAGVSCEMDKICDIARRRGLAVVEDAAQGVMSRYRGRALGTIGKLGCFSFHETKNYSMGEGGALLINNARDCERAEIIREKGTDRRKFLRGLVDKYTWVDLGSSYLPSELNAAYLYPQLLRAAAINEARLHSWQLYYSLLKALEDKGLISLPVIPKHCEHNAHMFYIKTDNIEQRTQLTAFLKKKSIASAFHYIPLHTAPAGRRFGRFHGEDRYTTRESERLLRLPMYYSLTDGEISCICEAVTEWAESGRADG